MNQFLKRLNNTSLTDDELILFDVLFDKYTSVRSLEGGEDFELFFNYPSHNYKVEQLSDVLNKHIEDGDMNIKIIAYEKQKQLSAFIGLTKKGGELWEKERRPDWNSYIIDYSAEINDGWELSVYSPSLKTAEKFIEISHKCKLYELKYPYKTTISMVDGKKLEHIPWKIFSKLYEIKAALAEKEYINGNPGIDWESYRQNLEWWRCVDELIDFNNKL